MNKTINPTLVSLILAGNISAIEPSELKRLEEDVKNHPSVMKGTTTFNGVSSEAYLLDVNGLKVKTSDFGFQVSYEGDNEGGTYYDIDKDGNIDGVTFGTGDKKDKGLYFNVIDMIADNFEDIEFKLSFSGMRKRLGNEDEIRFAIAFQPDGDIYTANFGEGVLLKSKNDSLKTVAQKEYDNKLSSIRNFLDNTKKDSVYK